MTEQQQMPLADDEIDLRELFKALWQGKWIIIVTTILFSVAAVFYALSLPNIYKSEVTLAPVSEESSLRIPGQLGGLAALAGVNLGGLSGGDKSGLALEILKSRDFISRFIEENDLYAEIVAAKGWNRSTGEIFFDPKKYDVNSKKWVRKIKAPYKAKPSNQEAFEEFKKIFNVSKDKSSGMIKLSIQHYSPYLAKKWTDKLVYEINEEMRNRDLAEAELSITYLNKQIESTNIADVRAMLFSLIEEQTKTVMLAKVREEYVLKTIDPSVASEKKFKPSRALIVIFVVVFSMLFSILIVSLRFFLKK